MTDPTIGSTFTVYDVDPGSQTDWPEQALVLKNGNLLLLAGELSSDADVFIRQFSTDGAAATPLAMANTTTFADQDGARVAQLQNGNILVAWTDESETAPDYDDAAVRFQLFDSKGNKIGSEATAPVTFDDDQILESIVPLNDGRFAVIWRDQFSWSSDPKFRIFNPDGSPAGDEQSLPDGFGNGGGGHVAASGPGGLIAVGVTTVSGKDTVAVQRYDASGTPKGEMVAVASGGDPRDETIVRLENGDYVVAWTDVSKTPPFNKGPIVQGQVISADGDKVGDIFTVSDDIFSEHSSATVTALSDGRFAVSWHMFPAGDFLSYKEVVRIYTADGEPDSGIVTVYDADEQYDGIRTGLGNLFDVSELADGRLIYTFRAFSQADGEVVAATRIVDPRDALDVSLSKASDTFTGTVYADRINGRNGNDTIDGHDGADMLFGSAGKDTLRGGTGNDRLDGGGGNDKLFGDDGNDRLNGGTGADMLTGGKGADTFVFATVKQAKGDRITDFSAKQGDVIDLSGIDADTGTRGDQAFDLIGANDFSGTAGELRVWTGKGNTFVAGDVDGDGTADFRFTLDGKHHLVDTDFLL